MTNGWPTPRPTPGIMPRRRTDLQPRVARQRGYATGPSAPRRFQPVDMAWCDSGFLYAVAQREPVFKQFSDLYVGALVITDAVEKEIRNQAEKSPSPHYDAGKLLMIRSANRIVQAIERGVIRIYELPTTATAMVGSVIDQLKGADEGRIVQPGVDSDERVVAVTEKNAGEAYSIVAAARVLAEGSSTVLLTDDGGASRVAESRGVRSLNVADVLRQLGCEDPQLTSEHLFAVCEAVTKSFGTLPTDARPRSAEDFKCKAVGGACSPCGWAGETSSPA
ncbi:hypothetical protein [Kitasatospora herbaricolor]|uniref:hypothetical protein n=1 Tax=Kitasatospora herbaricolor TaxID=68217 RepID=UPI0036D83279